MDALSAADFRDVVPAPRFSGGRQVGPVSFCVPAAACWSLKVEGVCRTDPCYAADRQRELRLPEREIVFAAARNRFPRGELQSLGTHRAGRPASVGS